jgi:hypothetical protein
MLQGSLKQKYFSSVLQPSTSSHDVVDAYLASPPIPSIQDPISYWQAMASNNDPFAQMALDYLSTPGKCFCFMHYIQYTNKPLLASSTDVERAFSKGRLNVSRLRHSLSDETTRAATVLGSWADVAGLVLEEDLVANIKNKRFRWGTNDVIEVD